MEGGGFIRFFFKTVNEPYDFVSVLVNETTTTIESRIHRSNIIGWRQSDKIHVLRGGTSITWDRNKMKNNKPIDSFKCADVLQPNITLF